jgi:hypothetical protein
MKARKAVFSSKMLAMYTAIMHAKVKPVCVKRRWGEERVWSETRVGEGGVG